MNIKTAIVSVVFLVAPLVGHAQDACVFANEDPKNCFRFVGCFNNGKATMAGTSRGWEEGVLYSEVSDGRVCTGVWKWDSFLKKGKGSYTCDDGDTADINFFARDETIPVTTGVSVSKSGKRLSMWSGPDLAGYFRQKFPEKTNDGFPCGDDWVAFPETYPDLPKQ